MRWRRQCAPRSLDDDIVPVVPGIDAGGDRDGAVRFQIEAFCSAGPVQNTNDSSCHVPTSGVTCGLPSGRTVVIQYSSAAAKSAETSLHAGAQAPGSLNR